MTMPLRQRLLRGAHQLTHGWPRGSDHIAHELLEMIETGSHTTCDLAATFGCRERDLEPLLLAMQRRGKLMPRATRHGTEWHTPDGEACS